MSTYAQTLYNDSEFGVPQDIPKAGVSLENPYAFDATAKELKHMAHSGLVEILHEHVSHAEPEELIDELTFVRLR
jgi:hypothetical protein